jgi:hypothetical protein
VGVGVWKQLDGARTLDEVIAWIESQAGQCGRSDRQVRGIGHAAGCEPSVAEQRAVRLKRFSLLVLLAKAVPVRSLQLGLDGPNVAVSTLDEQTRGGEHARIDHSQAVHTCK